MLELLELVPRVSIHCDFVVVEKLIIDEFGNTKRASRTAMTRALAFELMLALAEALDQSCARCDNVVSIRTHPASSGERGSESS